MISAFRFGVLLALALAIGCDGGGNKNSIPASQTQATRLTRVGLRQEWFANANYAGALFAATDFAAANRLEIEIRSGSETIDAVKTVLAGTDDFGDAGADKILAANSKGADLVVIGVVNLVSPACFITKVADGIDSPQQFAGHRIGVLTGTSTEYIYRALLHKSGVAAGKIHEVEAGFDLGSFIAGGYDVRPAFIYDEPVSLDTTGIAYKIIEPKDYGVNFLGTVYFTRGKMVREHPEVVQAFVNSVADGWRAALKHPEQAMAYLKKWDRDIDVRRETKSFNRLVPYVSRPDQRVLDAKPSDWNDTIGTLKSLGIVDSVDVSQTFNDRFIKKYYEMLTKSQGR